MSLKERITGYQDANKVEQNAVEKAYQYYHFDVGIINRCQRIKRRKAWANTDNIWFINWVFPDIHTAEEVEQFLVNDFNNMVRAPFALIDNDLSAGRFMCADGVVRRINLSIAQMDNLVAPLSLGVEVK